MITSRTRFVSDRSPRRTGFTLIELVITVAIIAILAAIAYPSYESYLIRSRRAAAQSYLMDLAQAEQRFLLDARSYTATETDLSPGGTPTAVSSYYTIAIVAPVASPPTFTITATATGKQAVDGNLTIDNLGVKTPAAKW